MSFIRNLSKLLTMASQKINYPSADRNKTYILEVLQKYIDKNKEGTILEISSGTGQHASYFASHFPKIIYQPSEYDTSLFKSIEAYATDLPEKNMRMPIRIDVTSDYKSWNTLDTFDYIININMIHISPFSCTIGLFKNCSAILKVKGLLFTYGPYANDGLLKPQSNINFDKGLRAQNSEWGVRDIQDLIKVASDYGIKLLEIIDLPANNKCLIWQKY